MCGQDEEFLELDITFATDCLVRPHSLKGSRNDWGRCPSCEQPRIGELGKKRVFQAQVASIELYGKAYRSTRASARRDTLREPGIEDDGVEERAECKEKKPHRLGVAHIS
ncbi:hypothetical protein TNCT_634421 [Trichonephila clavata]|uniref:Uncharacterized protein n=1 Tax=Trichonephila clavata TaxID=2740835 RepID=A0A8X6FLU7_TRICU|nr:hypothetical protein TNCT_634421 [Trichonephila clavata]